jgi:cortactin
VDKSAVGWEHVETVEKHESQKDYKTGFGGQYGIQADRVDKSAVGWEHKEELNKHESQKDYVKGFGGKFGVQSDRKDKAAHSYEEQTEAVGTNYEKTRPTVPTKNAANLRARFENMAQQVGINTLEESSEVYQETVDFSGQATCCLSRGSLNGWLGVTPESLIGR